MCLRSAHSANACSAAFLQLEEEALGNRRSHAWEVFFSFFQGDNFALKRVLDIEANINPISSFMSHCPDTVVVVEPCGELSHRRGAPYLSEQRACGDGLSVINNVFPTSIRTFIYDHMTSIFNTTTRWFVLGATLRMG